MTHSINSNPYKPNIENFSSTKIKPLASSSSSKTPRPLPIPPASKAMRPLPIPPISKVARPLPPLPVNKATRPLPTPPTNSPLETKKRKHASAAARLEKETSAAFNTFLKGDKGDIQTLKGFLKHGYEEKTILGKLLPKGPNIKSEETKVLEEIFNIVTELGNPIDKFPEDQDRIKFLLEKPSFNILVTINKNGEKKTYSLRDLLLKANFSYIDYTKINKAWREYGIGVYAGSGYGWMNALLKGETKKALLRMEVRESILEEKMLFALGYIASTLHDLAQLPDYGIPGKEKTYVYRGEPWGPRIEARIKAVEEGGGVTNELGFFSTSKENALPKFLEKGVGTILLNVKGKDISQLPNIPEAYEKEVLLPPTAIQWLGYKRIIDNKGNQFHLFYGKPVSPAN